MQLHDLKRKTKNRKFRQVGRGGKRGKTSGRGTKGQNARAGRKKRPEIRDIIKKLPKQRGRGVSPNKSIGPHAVVVNLALIDRKFSSGEVISPVSLVQKGIVAGLRGRRIKILGDGNITKKLTFTSCDFSASAREKITSAGGVIE